MMTKLSERNRRMWMNPEYKLVVGSKISKTLTGKHPSYKTREKMSLSKRGKNNSFYGRKHSEATKIKQRLAKLGKPSWNKGLTKETDERVRKSGENVSKVLLGKKNPKLSETRKRFFKEGKLKIIHSEETKQKIRITKLGKPKPSGFGEKISKIKRKAYIEGKIKVWNKGNGIEEKSCIFCKNIFKSRKIQNRIFCSKKCYFEWIRITHPQLNKKVLDITKHKMKLSAMKPERLEIAKQNLSKSDIKKNWQNPDYRENQIKKAKERWQDPLKKEIMLKKMLKGLMKRPTSLENKFIKIIRRRKLPYKYVGNGDFILGGKCPDFINTNGLKRCIEIRPKCMTQIWSKCSPEEYVKQRQEHFAKYGWECQVIWQEDFELQKIGFFK